MDSSYYQYCVFPGIDDSFSKHYETNGKGIYDKLSIVFQRGTSVPLLFCFSCIDYLSKIISSLY